MSARSVVNHEEFTNRLAQYATQQEPHIQEYILTVARKHFLKNFPHASTIKKPPGGVPKFYGLRDPNTNAVVDRIPLFIQTKEGPKLHYTSRNDLLYRMVKSGETVFLDMSYMGIIQEEIRELVQWMRAVYPQRRDLTSISYPDAQKKAAEWQQAREKAAEKKRKELIAELRVKALAGTVPIATVQYNTHDVLCDGLLLKLHTKEALEYEGARLHHCVGDSFYWKDVEIGLCEIWSYRQSLTEPMYTIEVKIDKDKGTKTLMQCRGLQNAEPNSLECEIIAKGMALFDVKMMLFTYWESLSENSTIIWSKTQSQDS